MKSIALKYLQNDTDNIFGSLYFYFSYYNAMLKYCLQQYFIAKPYSKNDIPWIINEMYSSVTGHHLSTHIVNNVEYPTTWGKCNLNNPYTFKFGN